MAESVDPTVYPELIFGLAGPIGVDLDAIGTTLERCLDDTNPSPSSSQTK